MKFNKNELEKITIDTTGNIKDQLEENGIDGRSQNDDIAIYNEINNNLTSILYMDGIGQLWKMSNVEKGDFQYIAKCRI